MMRREIRFCEERQSERQGVLYWGFTTSEYMAFAYGGSFDATKRVVKVEIIEDPEGTYWAWWDAEKQAFSVTMIWYHKGLLEMCFPYGMKVEEDRGKGKGLAVRIEVIEVVDPEVARKR